MDTSRTVATMVEGSTLRIVANLRHSTLAASMPSVDYRWLDELPVVPGPPNLRLGLRSLDEETWLIKDELTSALVAAKSSILDRHPEFVQTQDGSEAACRELLELVEGFVGERSVLRDTRHPVDAAARLVDEDLCVMARSDPTDSDAWYLTAGSLSFPNQWLLADKIGGSLLAIHGPTEGYAEELGTKANAFFDALRVGRSMWRRNWFFHDDDSYVQPNRAIQRTINSIDDIEPLWLRSERETLRLLPGSGAIVFTIKTQIAPLSALAARPQVAEGVARYLETATPAGLRGKDADGRKDVLIAYLRNY